MKTHSNKITKKEWQEGELAVKKLSKIAQEWYFGQDYYKLAKIEPLKEFCELYLLFPYYPSRFCNFYKSLKEIDKDFRKYYFNSQDENIEPW